MLKSTGAPLSRWAVAGALALGVAAAVLSAQSATSSPSGYVLCVNTTTKSVTYPGTATCPKGRTTLVVGAPAPASGSSSQDLASSLYDKVAAASYSVVCGDMVASGVGVNVGLDADAKKKGYKGAVLVASSAVEECDEDTVAVMQGKVNYRGFVWMIDLDNNLALVVTTVPVETLSPSTVEPRPGDFRMAVASTLDIPEGTLAIGYLNNLNPDTDEELHTLTVGNSGIVPEGAVVDSAGNIVSIAHMKPGVVCRALLSCSSTSPWLAWSA